MIIGFLLLDSGGTTLISKDYAGILKEQEVLFSGIMTAVNQVLQTIMKTHIRHIELERYHLYFRFSRNYILVVISDVEDDRLFSLTEKVLGDLEALGIDPDSIRFRSSTKDEVLSLIEKHVVEYPPSIIAVRRIAERIETLELESPNIVEVELDNLIPKMGFVEKKTLRTKPAVVGKVDFDLLLQKFLDGDFEDILRLAPRGFYEGDIPKVLYVKAALKVNSFDLAIQAPPLEFVYGTILSIEDEFLRVYLLFELKEFFDLDALRNKIKLVAIRKEHILRALEREHPVKEIYAIVLSSVPMQEFFGAIRSVLKTESEWIELELMRYELMNNMFSGQWLGFDEWNLRLSELRQKLNKVIDKEVELTYYYLLLIQMVYVLGLSLKELTIEDAEQLLRDILEQMDKYYSTFEGKDKRVPSYLKADNYYLTLGLILGIALDIWGKDKAGDILKRYCGIILRKIRWLRSMVQKHRIPLASYFRTISGLLASYTTITRYSYILVKNLPTIIKDLSSEFIENLWGCDEYTYAMIIMDLLTCLGNLAIFIRDIRHKEEILTEIAQLLERLHRFFEKVPLMSVLSAIRAIRFYVLSQKPENRKRCITILQEIKEKFPDFYYRLGEKILSSA